VTLAHHLGGDHLVDSGGVQVAALLQQHQTVDDRPRPASARI